MGIETQTVVARKIGEYRHLIVCSPKFEEKYGLPKSPGELVSFPCGIWRNGDETTYWNLAGKDYLINPIIKVNDYAHLLKLALNGEIITEFPPLFIQPLIDSGDVKTLFPEHPFPAVPLNLVYSSRKNLSPLTRTYIEFAIAYCEQWV